MGCTSSISKIFTVGKKRKMNIQEIVVFVPGMWIPVQLDLRRILRGVIPLDIVDRLSVVRNRIVLLAEETGGSAHTQLQQALQDYLPVLLGLANKELGLEELVEFKWKKLDNLRQETCLANTWFELLCVVYKMAILSLSEANTLLVPKDHVDDCERNVSEVGKKDAIDLLLKASGLLEFCIQHILVELNQDMKRRLPRDLQDGVLKALSIQALGQGTELQLGFAVESREATLSVKRRLACEQLSYFAQAHYHLSGCIINHESGKKHLLFIKWKYLEAKAAAYYYHGLILDKGNEPSSHISAVCCFLAADELLRDSKKACLSFCLAAPVTRTPPLWGVMKRLHQKIPDVASRKSQMYGYLLDQEKALQALPDLPDFSVSLGPEDYELPDLDPAWDIENWKTQAQTLKEHLKDGEDEMETE